MRQHDYDRMDCADVDDSAGLAVGAVFGIDICSFNTEFRFPNRVGQLVWLDRVSFVWKGKKCNAICAFLFQQSMLRTTNKIDNVMDGL